MDAPGLLTTASPVKVTPDSVFVLSSTFVLYVKDLLSRSAKMRLQSGGQD